MKKELCVTTDFYSDLFLTEKKLNQSHIDAIMQYSKSLGATRFEWVFDTMWNFYDPRQPLGYDVLKIACDSAHRHGMRFDVVYKPFESGLSISRMSLPHTFPDFPGANTVVTESGRLYVARPFVAQNLECRISRRTGDGEDPGGRLKEIRLIKFDEKEIALSPDDISFWYSSTNGNFKKYEGKLETAITKEWKLYYPYDDKLSTIWHFQGFNLPQDVKYFEIRCSKLDLDGNGSFSNHIESMVELINEHDQIIPSAPSTIQYNPQKTFDHTSKILKLGLIDYLNHPQVRKLLENYETFHDHYEKNCRGMYVFEPQWEIFTLDHKESGVLAVCRGKPMCHSSELHPIYPQVRKQWLDEIQYCIDRGVDGVNIRISRHGGMNEPWAYGFNDPVIEKLKNKDDVHEAAIVNGQAFDTFMQDAASLLHRNRKEIGVHLCGLILGSVDRIMAVPKPLNFVWNWEHWVRDIVDYTEFHKTNFFKFPKTKAILDQFSYVTNDANKPLIYQSGQSAAVTHYQKPYRFLPFEIDWIKNHPNINCYNLYETASFFRMNENGDYQGSSDMKDMMQQHWD